MYTIDGVEYIEYSHRQYTGSHTVQVCKSNSGGLPEMDQFGSNSAGVYKKRNIGGSSADDAIILIRDEVDAGIINNLTDPCAKSIFNALEMIKKNLLKEIMQPTAKVNLTFAESILKLFNDSDSAKLSITNGKLKDADGRTTGTSITISESYLKSASSLSIVRTMIHEMTHAYINTLFFDYNEFESLDFRRKLVKYAEVNGYGTDMSRIQHEFMGQYVEAMAVSLLRWDLNYGTGGIKTKTGSWIGIII